MGKLLTVVAAVAALAAGGVSITLATPAGGQGSGDEANWDIGRGVYPRPGDEAQFSVDAGSVSYSPVMAPPGYDVSNLVSSVPGILPPDYLFNFVPPGNAITPSHWGTTHPFDMGLLRNVPYGPATDPLGITLGNTNSDNVDALSHGHDYMVLDGQLTGPPLPWPVSPGESEYQWRSLHQFNVEPVVVGGTRVPIEFSVNRVAQGLRATGVNGLATSVAGPPQTPAASVYRSWVAGTNTVWALDGDIKLDIADDLDAYENLANGLSMLSDPDQTAQGVSGQGLPFVCFSVDRSTQGVPPAPGGHLIPNAVNVQRSTSIFGPGGNPHGHAAGDIFVSGGIMPAGMNLLLINEVQLGLDRGDNDLLTGTGTGTKGMQEDDLDALALLLNIDLEQRITELYFEQVGNELVLKDPSDWPVGTWVNPISGYQESGWIGIDIPLLDVAEAAVLFSVKEGSIGLPGSAVDWEHRINPSEESGDLFFSDLSGQNWLSYEAGNLGLLESDELNALDTVPEPATLAFLGVALPVLLRRRHR